MTPRTVYLSFLLLCLTASAQFGLRSPAFVGSLAPRAAAGGSAPAAPSSLIATGDPSGITLHWTDNSANETGFWIEFNEAGGGFQPYAANLNPPFDDNPTGANTNSFQITTGTTGAGTQAGLCDIVVRILATNSFGVSSYTSEVQVPPSIVIGDLDAVIDVGVQVNLAWTPTDETGGNNLTHIYRSINGAGYTDIGTRSGNEGEHFDDSVEVLTALGLMQTVLYKIRNQNDGGNGPYSNIATAHP